MMRISSVSNLNLNQKQQNFKGLWSKTVSHAPDYDPVIATTKKVEVAYYHPFLGESDSQITDVVNKNSSSRIVRGDGGRRQLLIRECRVCAPILISQDSYDKYMKLEKIEDFNSSSKHRTTHVYVKDKFKNSGFNQDENILDIKQEAAVNESINNALLSQINTIA